MKRVLILGCPGSGKSMFARKLQKKTGLPLIHLDNVWWKPDRTHITRAQFDARLAEILETDTWILDGDYSRTYEPRIKACDTAIFLDFDESVCMRGIEERVGSVRPDMPWTEPTLDPELVALVRRYRTENRPALLTLFDRYPDRRYLIFRTRESAAAWLDALTTM